MTIIEELKGLLEGTEYSDDYRNITEAIDNFDMDDAKDMIKMLIDKIETQ